MRSSRPAGCWVSRVCRSPRGPTGPGEPAGHHRRVVSDAVIVDALLATRNTPEGLYGRKKMTHYLRRCGHQVAFCTVDRPMHELAMNGLRRGKGVRTTVPGKDRARAGDLLNRDFTAPAPNTRWVADLTYCRTWLGFVYVAFIVDCFAQRIVGWHAASSKHTDLVLTRCGSHCGPATGKVIRSPPGT
jgi:putative transposase